MSTPMYDEPDHFPIDIDADGNGPALGADVARTVCWCGVDGCVEYLKP